MTLLLGFAAVNTGNNLLYLLVSALLGFMTISGLIGHWNLSGLQITLEPAEEIYDGLETLLPLRITNQRRWLPSFLLDIELGSGDSHLPLLKRGHSHHLCVPITLHGRGRHGQHRLTVRSSFPINFFIRSSTVAIDQVLVAFPRPQPCSLQGADQVRQRGGQPAAQRRGHDGDLHSIGDYGGGEPLKMIHWKLSARHDSLKVKQLSATQQQPLEINPDHLPGSGLEQRLSCAAYLINQAYRRQLPIGLRLGHRRWPAASGRRHKLHLLTELANYGSDYHAP